MSDGATEPGDGPSDAGQSPRPYGTAHGLPPPAPTPYGAAAPASARDPYGPPAQEQPPTSGPYSKPQGQPPPSSSPYGSPSAPRPYGQEPPRWGTSPANDQQPTSAPGQGSWRPPPSDGVPVAAAPPVNADDLARARRLARLGLYNAVIGVVLSLVFFPVGLIVDIVAITLGIRARRAAVRAQQSEGAGVVTVVLGGIGLSLAIALGTVLAVFWTEIRTYQSCSSGAITHSARAECDSALSEVVRRRLGMG